MAVDDTLLNRVRQKLYTAAISDTLDGLGLLNQALPSALRPLDETLILCGRARTGLYMPIYHDDEHTNVYELEIELVDDIKPGEVAVLSCGGNHTIAPWGELLSTAARARGAVGCVTDGLVRDIRVIKAMKFPVFAGGIGPLDTKHRGKMMMRDVPTRIGAALVCSGDIVFGDADGVVAVPQDVAAEVLARALDKVAAETTVRQELAAGARLKDVFAKHGIL